MQELPINKKEFNALVKEMRNYNEFPIFLPRYLTSTGKHPISVHLNILVDDVFGMLKICSDEEIEELIKSMPQGVTMILGPMPEWGEDEQKRRVAFCYIASKITRHYFNFKSVVKESIDKSEVLKKFPELNNKFDKDGLLVIDDGFILHPGGIEYRNYILHYHQLLRRGYNSNPNFDFLGNFINYYQLTKDENQFRIAIDHRRLMPKELYCQIFECDTWYGAQFNSQKIDDPKYVGLTIIKRNKNSLFDLTNRLDRTEFYWSYSRGVKTLEIEEISDVEYKFENFNFNKYLHTERDIVNKYFRHIDGAAKVYIINDYISRFQSKMPKESKCFNKIKLWRIDGVIQIKEWIDLISYFFKANEMILEYFNPEEFKRVFELRIRDYKKWKEQQI